MLHDIMIDPRQLKAAAEWAVSEIDHAAPVLLKMAPAQILRVAQGDARATFLYDGECSSQEGDGADDHGGPEYEAKLRATCSGCLARTYRGEDCVCTDGDAESYEVVLRALTSSREDGDA